MKNKKINNRQLKSRFERALPHSWTHHSPWEGRHDFDCLVDEAK